MPKSKKELDKDMMFKKIMPALADNPFSTLHASIEEAEAQAVARDPLFRTAGELIPQEEEDDLTKLRNKLFIRGGTVIDAERVATINIMEDLVLRHLDEVIEKFNCCRCDRCRRDIAAYALNRLPPKYVVADPRRIELIEREIPPKDVMNALVKAVIQVRSNPRH